MDYDRGLDLLRAQLEQTNRYIEFSVFESRLLDNLRDERLYGASENNRADRARVMSGLNQLALETMNISFNDLALGRHPGPRENSAISLISQLGVVPSPSSVQPPVQTHLQTLPLNELSWDQFEALCVAFIESQPITINCSLRGVQGDAQQGIDIVAIQRGKDREETWAYQCKRYKQYMPAQVRAAFDSMTYPADYYVLILSVPATVAMRSIVDQHNNLFLWDSKDLARKLKNYPTIVEDFFGVPWRTAFCSTTPST